MAKKRKRKNKKQKSKLLNIFIICVIGVMCIFLAVTGVFDKINSKIDKIKEEHYENTPQIRVVNLHSNERPVAVMINNHEKARPYHSGLQDAYIVYEILVEGGYTRYMAIYKDSNPERIGSIRSSRHYFIDYALENDAIYTHWGWSKKAENDIKELQINNLNGLTQENLYFFRDRSLPIPYEHTGFTSMELIKKGIRDMQYRSVTRKKTLLNYSIDEIDLSKMEKAIVANDIDISFSGIINTSYKYDNVNKVYKRYVNSKSHNDYVSKKQYTVKNIITYQVDNHTLVNDTKGRQDISNIGSGEGYYISNGYAVPILWSKESRSSQTKYTYLDGKEIDVNDGNTFIEIQPSGRRLNIS